MGIFVSWIYFWPEAKFISLATVHARLAPERLSWDDWTRMAHSHRDRQAKGILSRRLHEKAQIGARGPTSQRIPKLLSSTQSRRKKKQQNPLQKREEKVREAQGWPREQTYGYGMHNVHWSHSNIKSSRILAHTRRCTRECCGTNMKMWLTGGKGFFISYCSRTTGSRETIMRWLNENSA